MARDLNGNSTRRDEMNRQTTENPRQYDSPIPKPPDDLFDRFMRNVEDRLVTQRFDRDRRKDHASRRDDN